MTPSSLCRSVFLVLALAACAHVESRVVRLGPVLPPLPSSARVTLYRPPVPALRAREVAILEVTRFTDDASPTALLPTLRALARSVGADVLVWLRTDRAVGFVRVVASALRTTP